jgi:hypothetical protein
MNKERIADHDSHNFEGCGIRGPPQSVAICSLAVAICSGRGYLCLAVAICSFRKKICKKLILELILMFKKAFLPFST